MAVRNWIGFFLMGTINNLPYVIVNSAASTIVDSFDERDLVGLVFGANVALSVFVKSLNAFVLLKVPYHIRIVVNGCVMLIGLFGVAYAFNFGFAIACIAIIGSTSAFGENVTLGFLSLFPSALVSAWSSGTGMAGLLGGSIYIIFGCTVGNGGEKTEKLHHLTKYAFLLTTPVVLVYWLAYFVLIKRPPPANSGDNQAITVQVNTDSADVDPITKAPVPPQGAIMSPENIQDSDLRHSQSEEEKLTLIQSRQNEPYLRRLIRCLKLVAWLGTNLSAVYLFEYVVRGCANKVRPKNEYNVGCPELYAALQLCYQAGVFVSRSSVPMYRIKKVEILTVLQFLNLALWMFDVHFKFIPVSILPALMIFVGLLGGAAYVNIFYTLLHDDKFPDEDRELCVNLTGLFINLGIILGTGFETALFKTVLSKD